VSFWNAATLLVLVVVFNVYALGLLRFRASAGGRQAIRKWQAAAFFAGCIAAGFALLSSLDIASDIFFSAHMEQHEILMLIAAPLMVLGRPFIVTLWALPARARQSVASVARSNPTVSVWRAISGPLAVVVLHAGVLWIWHLPTMFEAALHNEAIHVVQHLMFFLTAALFWWALIHGRYGRIGYGVGVLYVFITAMNTEVLGALLSFASRPWYPTHAARTIAAGASAVEDQQFAGILMWIPFGVVFLLIALALFAAWLGEAERRVALAGTSRNEELS
jgi:putative membrane protein